MIVVQFREHLLNDGLTEQGGFRIYTELVTISPYGSHLAVIEVDNLTMPAHKGCLLLFQIFRIHSRDLYFLFPSHL